MSAIDISRYQGSVNFQQVKSAGVSLVIAKLGGEDAGQYVDANWAANRAGIRAAGLKLGSYLFNGPGSNPVSAADFHFANADWRPGDLIIIDVEGAGIAWSPDQVLQWANRIISHGIPASSVGVYMSASVVRNYNWAPVAQLGTFLWVASYGANTGTPGTPPSILHWSSCALWQYTSNGSIAGVPGRVDVSQIASNWAGSNVTPLTPTTTKESDMYLITHPNGQPALVFPDKFLMISAYTMGTLENVMGQPVAAGADEWTFLSQNCVPAVPPAPDLSALLAQIEAALTAEGTGIEADVEGKVLAAISAITVGTDPTSSPVLAAVQALSTSDSNYLQQIEAELAKGFTITGTVK